MRDARTKIVADGYGEMGETFAALREEIVGDPRREWEDELVSRLEPGARLLELGCGSGTPGTKRLVREAGFTIARDEVVVFQEPKQEARFQWVLAQA